MRVPHLKTLLRANAVFAGSTGLIAIAAGRRVSRFIDIAQPWLVSGTGILLVTFSAGLVVASALAVPRMVAVARWISTADAAWVVASGFVLVFADLSSDGNALIGLVAVVVAAFAALQIWSAAKLNEQPPHRSIEVRSVLRGEPDDVWAAVIDHRAYGELAPNLSKVLPTGPDGKDLTRRCWDTRGKHWDERCVVWEDGRRFAVEVDTTADDYPYPLDYLRGEWAIEPVGDRETEVTVRFELRPSPGPTGAAVAAAMTAGTKPIVRRIARGWQEIVEREPVARGASS